MPKPRGLSKALDKLTIGEDDWVEIRRDLPAGEQTDIAFARVRAHAGDEAAIRRVRFLPLALSIHAWSFMHVDGHAIPWPVNASTDTKIDILRGLDEDSFEELRVAYEAHRERQEEEKKRRSGATASAVISPSAA